MPRCFGVCWANADKSDLSYCVFDTRECRGVWLSEEQFYEHRATATLAAYPELRNALRQDGPPLGVEDRISWFYQSEIREAL